MLIAEPDFVCLLELMGQLWYKKLHHNKRGSIWNRIYSYEILKSFY